MVVKAVAFGPSDIGVLNGKLEAGFAAMLIIVVEGAVERAVVASEWRAVSSMGDLVGCDVAVVDGGFEVAVVIAACDGKRFVCINNELGCISKALAGVDCGAVVSKVAPLVTGNAPGIKPGGLK